MQNLLIFTELAIMSFLLGLPLLPKPYFVVFIAESRATRLYASAYPDNNSHSPKNLHSVQSDDPKIKGDDFEKFVVGLFSQKFFTILEWRSDKGHNGVYPLSNRYPDLEVCFSSNHYLEIKFALECKWRNKLNGEPFKWAEDYQFANYKYYQRERNLKVFIIIGIGGSPSEPKDMYVIPLARIDGILLTTDFLKQFKRDKADKSFFLHPDEMRLE